MSSPYKCGKYSTWTAAEFGKRISRLVDTDPDKIAADGKRNQLGNDAYENELERILNCRNVVMLNSQSSSHTSLLCVITQRTMMLLTIRPL